MLLFNEKNKFVIAKFEDFGVDLVSYSSISAFLIGDIDFINYVDETFILECIPFNQQLAKISSDSDGYDKKTGLTKIRLDLNSMSCNKYKFLVYSATKISNPINQIVRNSEKASYPANEPYSLPNKLNVIGLFKDEAYLDIKDYTNLVIPVSECFRQFRLNQNYVELVNVNLGYVNLIKRINVLKTLFIDRAIEFEKIADEKYIPKYIVAYQFTPKEWVIGQTRYESAGYYEVAQVDDELVVKWKGSSYTGSLGEDVEVILVGLNDNYDYQNSKNEIIEVTNIAQNKLDELEHDYNFSLKIRLDRNDFVNPRNIFECLGEVICLRNSNHLLNIKLTAFKYDFNTKIFTLTFGTKRIGINKIIKEMSR